MRQILQSMRFLAWITLWTGVGYPALMTGVGHFVFPDRSEGSWVHVGGNLVGSALIGQPFKSERYFFARPSAVQNNPLPSGGSNLSPASAALQAIVRERETEWGRSSSDAAPADLLFASASGVDPHLTPQGAFAQVERVAKARGLASDAIRELVARNVEEPQFGFLGRPRVNVLLLNRSLDAMVDPPPSASLEP